MKFVGLFILGIFLALPPCLPAQSPPRIFFSDLESGPNTGGQNNKGVWVTIWGKGFGAERGRSTVTIGGGDKTIGGGDKSGARGGHTGTAE